jgi:hypothetical protein
MPKIRLQNEGRTLNVVQRRNPGHRRTSVGHVGDADRGRDIQGQQDSPWRYKKTESDALQRYSPELQKKALARREQTQQGFDDFTRQLRELSKSDKPSKPFLIMLDLLS